MLLEQVFTKCGIIKEDDEGKPRIKLYRDKGTGMIKGDGLVTYLKEPSVSITLKGMFLSLIVTVVMHWVHIYLVAHLRSAD